MGQMLSIYISKSSNHDATRKCDTNGEHDHEQCAHMHKKSNQSHSHNHLGQNNIVKVHIPHLKDY